MIINSILDNDLYKFTMQQIALHQYPSATAKYTFINRGHQKFNRELVRTLTNNVCAMFELKLDSCYERNFLKSLSFLRPWYIEYLTNYRFNPAQVKIDLYDGDLSISIEGPWHETILWEVPLMALVSELYFKIVEPGWDSYGWAREQSNKIINKCTKLTASNVKFADFGTRRRRSYAVQKLLVNDMRNTPGNVFVGTSNVHLAEMYGIKPIGTMAHEWVQAISALESINHANRYMMEKWADFYDGNLGIALTDTYGLRAFIVDFSPRLAKLFDGVRHDSGCPFEFTDRIVSLYRSFGIDTLSKTIVFSDGLNVDKAVKLKDYCAASGIKCSFGIGTNFTNDFDNSNPLNMVIKLSNINGMPVVKLSEDSGKEVGSKDAIAAIKTIYLGKC